MRPSARRVLACAALVAAVATATAGCSNREAPINKEPHTGVEVAKLTHGVQLAVVKTGADFRFHPSTIIVHRGVVRIVLRNTEPASGGPPHNLHVTGLPGITVPLTYPAHAAEDTFVAPKPGRYRFICTIHVAQGQTGVLIVKPGPAPS
jgi:plastocyanin